MKQFSRANFYSKNLNLFDISSAIFSPKTKFFEKTQKKEAEIDKFTRVEN